MSTPSRSTTGRGPLITATLIVLAIVVTIAVLFAGGATLGGVWQSFFPPAPVTDRAHEVKSLYDIVFYIAVAIFLIVEVTIIYTVFRYRRKPGDDELPPQTHGNNLVEVIWTVVPTVIVAVLFFLSWQSLNKVDTVSANVPVQIRAVAARFQWAFDYLDAASTDPARDTALFTQFLPQGEGGGMVVPVGQAVKVTLISPDVIHAFYVPRFLFKRDVVPGRANQFEFTVDEPGVYRGQCAELCGAFHGSMVFEVRALPQAEYQAWLDQQLANANASPAPPPSGGPSPSGPAASGPAASGPAPSGGGEPTGAVVNISAANLAYEQPAVDAPAGGGFTIHFDNKDTAVPHNVSLKDASGAEVFKGAIFQGPGAQDYQVPALAPGTYQFVCSVHPNMTGTLTAK
jgi:cytochrome c oxidase subunit 2